MAISDEEMLAGLPDIRIDHDNKEYYRGLLEHRLLINRCVQCSTWHFPPRASCPKCWSWDIAPTEVSGKGTIHHFSFRNDLPAHGAPKEPYPVVAVNLDEGVRFTSTLIGCAKSNLKIGMRVELAWIENGAPFPAFRPVSQ